MDSRARLNHHIYTLSCAGVIRNAISDAANESDDIVITRAIINLAHILNLSVVAEGMETQGQLDFLMAHHCETVHGFLFSPPLPAESKPALLQRGFDVAM